MWVCCSTLHLFVNHKVSNVSRVPVTTELLPQTFGITNG